jgi:hypothetical protein
VAPEGSDVLDEAVAEEVEAPKAVGGETVQADAA